MPVGGIVPKIRAAKEAGAKQVVIPAENWQDSFGEETEIQIIPVRRIEEVIRLTLCPEPAGEKEAEGDRPEREKVKPVQNEELVVATGS